jgi:hypothetical protein
MIGITHAAGQHCTGSFCSARATVYGVSRDVDCFGMFVMLRMTADSDVPLMFRDSLQLYRPSCCAVADVRQTTRAFFQRPLGSHYIASHHLNPHTCPAVSMKG